jgi:hypothetical protein
MTDKYLDINDPDDAKSVDSSFGSGSRAPDGGARGPLRKVGIHMLYCPFGQWFAPFPALV